MYRGGLPSNRVVCRLPNPQPDGRTALSLTPLELLDRLAVLIPPPRRHRHRYHGVLAPHAPLRAAVAAYGRDATDADGDVPLAYAWSFGSAAPASSVQDPDAVRFTTAGTFAVTFRATDSAGLACATPARVKMTVRTPSGAASFTAHAINSSYVASGHKSDWKSRPSFCRNCHGANLQRSSASATFAARAWPSKIRQPDGSKTKRYATGAIVGCVECHGAPDLDDDEERSGDDDSEGDRNRADRGEEDENASDRNRADRRSHD